MRETLTPAFLAPSTGSLEAYIAYVNSIPLLTVDEEREYARRFREENDIDSARQLVLAHLRYVVRLAKTYMGYDLPLSDLIQEGNVGLMKAVKRFDPSVGVRLVSFAVHWIKAEIYEFVLRNFRIVNAVTTKARKKLFFNFRQKKTHDNPLNQKEKQHIADQLGVKTRDVELMETLMYSKDTPFETFATEDEDGYSHSPHHYLHDNNNPADLIEKDEGGERGREGLHYALEMLDKRSQDILERRWLSEEKATLNELADEYGVSAERIRQLEKNALKKLRACMQQ